MSRRDETKGLLSDTADLLDHARIRVVDESDRKHTAANVGWFIAQNIYTPKDISSPDLIANDRPYAGWLQVGIIDRSTTYDGNDDTRRDTVSQIDASIGVTGPPSLADQTQTLWHETFGFTTPRGWSHQIGFEPTLQLNWGLSRRLFYQGLGSRFGADISAATDASLGTVLIGTGVGTTTRVGWNLLRDFAPAIQEPSPFEGLRGSLRPTFAGMNEWWQGSANWSVYLFGGAYGRAVGRNEFLDGTLFSSSHSVEREDFVSELRTGVSTRYGPYFLTYSLVVRSREFEEDVDAIHRFGAVSFGLNWIF